MKLAILSVLFCRYPLEKVFEVVSKIGYDGIDLYGGRPHAYAYDVDKSFTAKIDELKKRYNIEIPMYTPEILAYPYNIPSPDAVERKATLDYLCRSIEAASDLSIKRMQITCGHSGYLTTRDQNMDNIYSVLNPLTAKAEKEGVTIILEPLTVMESNTIVFADDLVEVLSHINSPNLKTMMDTVTPAANREEFSDHFEKLGNLIDYIHLVDSNGIDESHMLLGTGVLDIFYFKELFKRFNYDNWLCVEIIGQFILRPEMYAAREYRKIKEIFEC